MKVRSAGEIEKLTDSYFFNQYYKITSESNAKSEYQVELDDAAERDFSKLSPKAKNQVAKLIDTLITDPFSGNMRELVGYEGVYRKRTGDYRVICTIEKYVLTVTVVAVGPRKDIYEMLRRRIK